MVTLRLTLPAPRIAQGLPGSGRGSVAVRVPSCVSRGAVAPAARSRHRPAARVCAGLFRTFVADDADVVRVAQIEERRAPDRPGGALRCRHADQPARGPSASKSTAVRSPAAYCSNTPPHQWCPVGVDLDGAVLTALPIRLDQTAMNLHIVKTVPGRPVDLVHDAVGHLMVAMYSNIRCRSGRSADGSPRASAGAGRSGLTSRSACSPSSPPLTDVEWYWPAGYASGSSPRSAKTFFAVNVAFRARGNPQ